MIVNDSKFITSGFGNFCGSVAWGNDMKIPRT